MGSACVNYVNGCTDDAQGGRGEEIERRSVKFWPDRGIEVPVFND